MPNPFHDETGRFCSKEEMGQAVDRLYTAMTSAPQPFAQNEATEKWFELKREYEQIQRGVVEIPESWVAEVSRSGLQNPLPESAAGIEAIYRSGLSDELRKPSDFHTSKAVSLFVNEHTPEWIKNDIYREASAEIKAGIIEEFSGYRGKNHPEITSEDLLPFTWGNNGSNPKVTKALLSSDRLGFDTKYELAKNRGQLGWMLSQDKNREAERYARIPEIESDLRREWTSPLRPGESRNYAAFALARNTQDVDLRQKLLDSDLGAVLHGENIATAIAQNPNISEDEGIRLLDRTVKREAANFELVHSWLSNNLSASEALSQNYRVLASEFTSTKAYKGADEQTLADAQARVSTKYSAELDEGVERFPAYSRLNVELPAKALGLERAADYWQQQAILDAEPGRYEELHKEAKRVEKERTRNARQGNRDAHRALHDESVWLLTRAANAKRLRVNSLVVDEIKKDAAAIAARDLRVGAVV